jgi:Spy/CpxP family protein refolding chaperone
MPKFAILLLPALLTGFSAFAQDATQTPSATTPAPSATTSSRHHAMHGDRAGQRLKRLSKRLGLTDDQKEKIAPILQDEDKQLTSLDSDAALTTQQKHKKTREIRMTAREQMDGILTPEQKAKMPKQRTRTPGQHSTHSGKANSGTKPQSSDPQQ